ncbi:hypothetical protein GCM10020220_114150 [Nonomuraea rubra]|uniref:alpha-L-arabinofuranosidase C-terminal domain-containing protein n=1 Tax=Nonomuraea rubra TaxID=46180 RepID=UPI0031E7269B
MAVRRDQKADLVDEHYTTTPTGSLANNHRYDTYDRQGPKVFVGEYASRGNTFYNALSEALVHRPGWNANSDVVELASYAPLLANVDYVDWDAGTLIWVQTTTTAYGSPSYHVQRLFSTNVGERVVPSTFEGLRPGPSRTSRARSASAPGTPRSATTTSTVTAADGTVLLSDDFSAGAGAWTPGLGTWAVQDGRVRADSAGRGRQSPRGSADWFELHDRAHTARKTAGAEGFLVMCSACVTPATLWWNVGGWKQHPVRHREGRQRRQVLDRPPRPPRYETGRDHR